MCRFVCADQSPFCDWDRYDGGNRAYILWGGLDYCGGAEFFSTGTLLLLFELFVSDASIRATILEDRIVRAAASFTTVLNVGLPGQSVRTREERSARRRAPLTQ